ncbi:hypothetical protein PV328_004112 [Microctonus aethiopoides]|uniref:Uncharacterized protein n=1 Tax=Microctonus aethiopoides TaxID=144406 RepID=A0AA39KL86_9HYME|nr:hypothetical protein PV328_004112 [Microctonus aethiopoides]
MDTTGQDGSIPAGPQIPKDGVKKRNRCGAAKKRARKAKAERELQLLHTLKSESMRALQSGLSCTQQGPCSAADRCIPDTGTVCLQGAHQGDRIYAWTDHLQAIRAGTKGLHICQQEIPGNQVGSPVYQRLGCSIDPDSGWGNQDQAHCGVGLPTIRFCRGPHY